MEVSGEELEEAHLGEYGLRGVVRVAGGSEGHACLGWEVCNLSDDGTDLPPTGLGDGDGEGDREGEGHVLFDW